MKKSRPANTLSILCKHKLASKLKTIVFENTTSLGIREYTVKKNMLKRIEKTVETQFGTVRIKESYLNGKVTTSKAEFEDCKKLAQKHNVSIDTIEKEALYNLTTNIDKK